MAEIVITDRMLERAAYWLIIILLIILLVFVYLRTPTCEAGETVTVTTETEETQNTTTVEENTTEEPEVNLCEDGIKNQDETDVDCGGDECTACAEGEACELNSDCKKGNCDDGECIARPELSGKIDFSIDNVDYDKNDNDKAKLTGVTISIENGLSSSQHLTMELFIKDDADFNFISQIQKGGRDPYAIIELPPLPAGAKLESQSYDLEGLYEGPSWIFDSYENSYDPGDDFTVFIEVIDDDNDVVESATFKVNV